MGRLDQEKIKTVWHQLEKAKIFNIGELASLLTCSVPNARLKLKQWQAYTSYNQNGKYYTLPQVPGLTIMVLWRYKNAAFSRHGNLKKTVIHLVSCLACRAFRKTTWRDSRSFTSVISSSFP